MITNKNSIIIHIAIIYLALATQATALQAEATYQNLSELVCDDTKVQVITKCADENFGFPLCFEQNIYFISLKTNTKIIIPASGKPYDEMDVNGVKIGRWLEGLATSFKCSKSNTHSYLFVGYNNGGNCDECEWVEVLDLKGVFIASNKYKNDRSKFGSKIKLLDLTEAGPEFDIQIGKLD
jgi:hypothetical protein